MTNNVKVAGTWVAILASVIIVFGTIAHAAKTDPAREIHGSAYDAVGGIVIPPFNR